MDLQALLDPSSALIVVGGTFAGTMLRSGRADWLACAWLIERLGSARFRYHRARAQLAPFVAAVRRDGVHRARTSDTGDVDLTEATSALIRHRSLAALVATHERQCLRRGASRERVERLLGLAGELAPVFGLAGTLVALSQLNSPSAPSDAPDGATTAIGMAVVTTLYGLLATHLVLLPLARLVNRAGRREEAERQRLVDWLVAQLRDAVPGFTPVPAGSSPAERHRAGHHGCAA